MSDQSDFYLPPEAKADIEATLMSPRECLAYWILTGFPEGFEEYYTKEEIEEVKEALRHKQIKRFANSTYPPPS